MPCLSIKQKFLLLIIAALLLGFGQKGYTEGLSVFEESIKAGNISEDNNQSADELSISGINKSQPNQAKKLNLAKAIKIKSKQYKTKFFTIAGEAIIKLKS